MSEEFDQFAHNYDQHLAKGLSATGENKDYFARERIKWLAEFLNDSGISNPRSIMDFGCGHGGSISLLADTFSPERLVGVDVSSESIEIAAREHKHVCGAEFCTLSTHSPAGEFDLVFTNGVFHHIPLSERAAALNYVHRALKPGGLFAFWENNPWNPGTRYVMSRIPFDRDAKMVFPSRAAHAMRAAGFIIERKDFLFVFPAFLKGLRGLEPMLARFPVGGQYFIAGRRPL